MVVSDGDITATNNGIYIGSGSITATNGDGVHISGSLKAHDTGVFVGAELLVNVR